MGKRKPNKRTCQQIHFSRRAETRLEGGLFSRHDVCAIIKAIQTGNTAIAKFHDRQSTRVTRWLVTYKDYSFAVVYDSFRKELVTLLPLEFLEGK